MHPCPRDASVVCLSLASLPRDASRSGRDWQSGSVGEDRTQAPSASGLVWSGAHGCLGTPSHTKLLKDRAPSWIPCLPINRDMYRYNRDQKGLHTGSAGILCDHAAKAQARAKKPAMFSECALLSHSASFTHT